MSLKTLLGEDFIYLHFFVCVSGNNPFEAKVLSADQADFVKQRFRMGRRKYTNLSKFYKEQLSITHPCSDTVRARELELMPKLTKVECDGVWANVSEVVQKNLEGTLKHLVKDEALENINANDIKGFYTSGADGSGNNPVFQSLNNTKSPNIILYGMRLQKVVSGDKELYVEKSLGGETEIPVGLIPCKETYDILESSLQRFEDQIEVAANSTHTINVRGKVIFSNIF